MTLLFRVLIYCLQFCRSWIRLFQWPIFPIEKNNIKKFRINFYIAFSLKFKLFIIIKSTKMKFLFSKLFLIEIVLFLNQTNVRLKWYSSAKMTWCAEQSFTPVTRTPNYRWNDTSTTKSLKWYSSAMWTWCAEKRDTPLTRTPNY